MGKTMTKWSPDVALTRNPFDVKYPHQWRPLPKETPTLRPVTEPIPQTSERFLVEAQLRAKDWADHVATNGSERIGYNDSGHMVVLKGARRIFSGPIWRPP